MRGAASPTDLLSKMEERASQLLVVRRILVDGRDRASPEDAVAVRQLATSASEPGAWSALFPTGGSSTCVEHSKPYSYRSARTGGTAATDIPESIPAATKTTTEPARIARSEHALKTGV